MEILLALSGKPLIFTLIGSMIVGALALVGALIAAISCTDRQDPKGLSYPEWKDGRIAPYSHTDDI